MRFLKYFLLIFIITLQSCKSLKTVKDNQNTNTLEEIFSADKIVKNHLNGFFNKKTIDAKLAVNFKNEKEDVNLSVRMKIEKGKVIWLKGSKIITVFKIKITPEKFSYYSPFYKNYFEGDFSLLKNFLGTDINYNQLENLLLGQAMFDLDRAHQVKIQNNNIVFFPKIQEQLFDVFYNYNPASFKLNQQKILSNTKNQELTINYNSYSSNEGGIIPNNMDILVEQNNKKTTVSLKTRTVSFDKKLTIPFKIPQGYKALKIK